jgi:hypothetical protein
MLLRHLAWSLPAFSFAPVIVACDPTEVATECVQNDIIDACPVGSNPVLGAAAETACGGSFEGDLVT